MSALQLISFAVLALLGVSQAQYYGRVAPIRGVPPYPLAAPCYGPDDLSALLLLARAVAPCDDSTSADTIKTLANALVSSTANAGTGGAGGSGGAGGAGGTGGSAGSVITIPKPTPRPTPNPASNQEPALIDLGLLTGDDLLSLIIAGQTLLNLDVGQGGGAVTKLVDGLI